MRFLLDANIFIDAYRRYYAFEIVPSFWTFLDRHFKSGDLVSIDPVFDELYEKRDDLANWAEQRRTYFNGISDVATVQKLADVSNWVVSQNFDHSAVDKFLNDTADYYLVAYAAAHGLTILTHEQLKPEAKSRVPIPNVCEAFSVPYTNTFEMMRVLKARF